MHKKHPHAERMERLQWFSGTSRGRQRAKRGRRVPGAVSRFDSPHQRSKFPLPWSKESASSKSWPGSKSRGMAPPVVARRCIAATRPRRHAYGVRFA